MLESLDPSLLEPYASRKRYCSSEDFDLYSSGSIGVSLHYRNRLFVDLYTGTDITPDSIVNYILDVRYAV